MLNDIYKIPKAAGQLAFSSFCEKEVLGNTAIEADIFSGKFLTFGTTPGKFKEVSATSERVIGMVIFQEQNVDPDDVYGRSKIKANQKVPYVKQFNLAYVYTNVDVLAGDRVYIDITNANLALKGNVTNVSTGNVQIPSAMFEQEAKAGQLALISCNLPNFN